MALHNTGATSCGVDRPDTGLSTSIWSASFWFYCDSFATYTRAFLFGVGGNNGSASCIFVNRASDQQTYLGLMDEDGVYNQGTTVLAATTWYHVGWSKNGAQSYVRLDAAAETSSATGITLTQKGISIFGKAQYSWVDHDTAQIGRIAAFKYWNAAVLSSAELDAEKDSYAVSRSADLYANWKMDGVDVSSCLTDTSGNGNNLSLDGSCLTVASGPSISGSGVARNPASMGFVLE